MTETLATSARRSLRLSLALTLYLWGFLTACGPGASAEEISREALNERLASRPDSVVVVDVRSVAEFRRGHVPGALHLPHDRLEALLQTLERHRQKTLVTYCQSGGRAGRVNRALRKAGFEDVRHLSGDFPGWLRAGMPTDTPASSRGDRSLAAGE